MSQMFSARSQHNDPQPTQRRRRADLPLRDYLWGDASAACAVMSAPERIWAWNTANCDGDWTIAEGQGIPYIRADLALQWQDIATAPHDTDVLLFCPDLGVQSNRARIELGPYSTGRRVGNTSSMSFHSWATHWMPLPTPPEPTQ